MNEQERLLQEINEREKQRDIKKEVEQKGGLQLLCCWLPGCLIIGPILIGSAVWMLNKLLGN